MNKINPIIKDVLRELGDHKFDKLISDLQCENPKCKDFGKSTRSVEKSVKIKDDEPKYSENMLIDCECGDLYMKVEDKIIQHLQK